MPSGIHRIVSDTEIFQDDVAEYGVEAALLKRHVNETIRRISFQPTKIDNLAPAIELRVPFSDEEYLRKCGDEAKRRGIIRAFVIGQAHEHYDWEGVPVEGNIFILKSLFPYDENVPLRESPILSAILEARTFFEEEIQEFWRVPLTQIYETLVNRKFADFLKSQWVETYLKQRPVKRKQRKFSTQTSYPDIWTYGGAGIHLWNGGWAYDVVGRNREISSDAHEKLLTYWNRWIDRYGGEEDQNNPHVALIDAYRDRPRGTIVPQRTTIYIFDPYYHPLDIFDAISSGKGLSSWDKMKLEELLDKITIVVPYDKD